MSHDTSRERGFSLIELLVAMVVTLLIAGGIFGLLYDSNRTFGREPAVSEQQQNARIALSLIEADLISAGAGAGPLTQVFTDGLNNLATDSTGTASPVSVINALAGAGGRSDALEVRTAVNECPTLQLCDPLTGGVATLFERIPACMRMPGLVVITDNKGHSYTRWACGSGAAPPTGTLGTCSTSPTPNINGRVAFPSGDGGTGCTAPGVDCNAGNGVDTAPNLDTDTAFLSAINKVRYEVRAAGDGVPSLWRSPSGGTAGTQDTTSSCYPTNLVNGSDWQLVARGIEDLQVRYRNSNSAPDTWSETPGPVACSGAPGASPQWCTTPTDAEYRTIVREVEVRLSTRVVTPHHLEGEAQVAGVATARRAEVRTVIAPRAAIMSLQAVGILQ